MADGRPRVDAPNSAAELDAEYVLDTVADALSGTPIPQDRAVATRDALDRLSYLWRRGIRADDPDQALTAVANALLRRGELTSPNAAALTRLRRALGVSDG